VAATVKYVVTELSDDCLSAASSAAEELLIRRQARRSLPSFIEARIELLSDELNRGVMSMPIGMDAGFLSLLGSSAIAALDATSNELGAA
jgi:hypothetical protein